MVTIENKYLLVKINEFGAELTSIFDKDLNQELLYQKTSNWQRQAPVLFPIVGKLKDDSYLYKGYKYQLSQHGFARDREFLLVELAPKKAIFELVYDENTYQLYPFKFKLVIEYKLKKRKLEVVYRVFNLDDYQMLYSVGGHPAFVVDNYDSSHVVIKPRKKTERYFLDGSYLLNSSDQFDEVISIEGNSQLKDTYIFSNLKKAKLELKQYSIQIASKKMPMFGIWASDLDCHFVCLEPWWGVCDKSNHLGELSNKYMINFLPKHSKKEHSYIIKIKHYK